MDNLTHSLVGVALARGGFDRATPLATATLVVAANAPDIDVLSYLRGGWFALSFRRGITHGLPALVVLPFAVAAAMLLWDREVRRRRRPEAEPARPTAILGLAFLGLVTHPALDWMNTYGMRWWLPFDGRWSYGDSLFIIDPWIWLALGGAVVLSRSPAPPRHERSGTFRLPRPRLSTVGWSALAAITSALVLGSGMVSATAQGIWLVALAGVTVAAMTGRPRSPGGRRQLARAAMAIIVAYVGANVGASRAAAADVRTALSAELNGEDEVMIAPRPAQPLEWDVLVENGATYVRGSYRWAASPHLAMARDSETQKVVPGPGVTATDATQAVAAARLYRDVAHYLVWSRFPVWEVDVAKGGWRVRVGDARYGDRGGGLGGLTVLIPRR